MNEFTGERVIPGQVEIDLWNEHVSRYAFGSRFAARKRVLDAGCGSGYGAAELSRTARFVVGVDISMDAVRYTHEHFPLENLRVAAASASALPFADASFDLVTAFEVIEHLEDWSKLIREARRVLAPGGLCVVSTPNKTYYAESRGSTGENPFHVHEFEAVEFVTALREVFPQVKLLLQNRSEAFVFYPPKTFWDTSARIESSRGTEEDAHFFIALCSDQPLEHLQSFVYVPAAVNIVRERDQHISLLKRSLADCGAAHSALATHLEQQNRWALDLETKWNAARERIVELQDAYSADVQKYEEKVAELDEENRKKTEWALETERRLTADIERFRAQLAETVRLLECAEATVEERTRWALDLKGKLEHAEAQLAAAKASRWIRAGRMFGVGPEL